MGYSDVVRSGAVNGVSSAEWSLSSANYQGKLFVATLYSPTIDDAYDGLPVLQNPSIGDHVSFIFNVRQEGSPEQKRFVFNGTVDNIAYNTGADYYGSVRDFTAVDDDLDLAGFPDADGVISYSSVGASLKFECNHVYGDCVAVIRLTSFGSLQFTQTVTMAKDYSVGIESVTITHYEEDGGSDDAPDIPDVPTPASLSRNYDDKDAIIVKNPIADALDRLSAAVKGSSSGGSGGKDNIDVTFVNMTNNVASIIVVNTIDESEDIAGGYLRPRIVSVVGGDSSTMSPGTAVFSVCNESTISLVDSSGCSFAEDSYQLTAGIPDNLTQYEEFENAIVIYPYDGGDGGDR